jgi:hypothetical protein
LVAQKTQSYGVWFGSFNFGDGTGASFSTHKLGKKRKKESKDILKIKEKST